MRSLKHKEMYCVYSGIPSEIVFLFQTLLGSEGLQIVNRERSLHVLTTVTSGTWTSLEIKLDLLPCFDM